MSSAPIVIHDPRRGFDFKCGFRKRVVFRASEHDLIGIDSGRQLFSGSGCDLAGLAQLIIHSYPIENIVLQVRNSPPSGPFSVEDPTGAVLVTSGPHFRTYQLPATAVWEIVFPFDNCMYRAHWMLALLPSPYTEQDTVVRSAEFCAEMLAEPSRMGGAFIYNDTDSDVLVGTLCRSVPHSTQFVSDLIDRGIARWAGGGDL